MRDNARYSAYGAARLRPSAGEIPTLVRCSEPQAFYFADDGAVPNHPAWPLLVFRDALQFPGELAAIAIVNDVFGSNGWGGSWFGSIYDFLHYHSRVNEAFGVVSGGAHVRFGGRDGRIVTLSKGDVVIIPAGVGHQRLLMSEDFSCVFAYPAAGTYDECHPGEPRAKLDRQRIGEVKRPETDPLLGRNGPLLDYWPF